jgi:hypothetical protein
VSQVIELLLLFSSISTPPRYALQLEMLTPTAADQQQQNIKQH